MYLSKKDFTDHGYTSGCTGCRDLASGKKKQRAPHTVACRSRTEAAVREHDPDRWERFLLRRRQEEVARDDSGSKEGIPSGPHLPPDEDSPRHAETEREEGEADEGSLFGGWEHRDTDDGVLHDSSLAPAGDLGRATPSEDLPAAWHKCCARHGYVRKTTTEWDNVGRPHIHV